MSNPNYSAAKDAGKPHFVKAIMVISEVNDNVAKNIQIEKINMFLMVAHQVVTF